MLRQSLPPCMRHPQHVQPAELALERRKLHLNARNPTCSRAAADQTLTTPPMHAGAPVPAPPPGPAPCCTDAAPICSCIGCATFEDIAATICLYNPPEPYDCCAPDPSDYAPREVPSVPFDGEDCCDDTSLCCCGVCRLPEVCAATTCATVPEDAPDNPRPCCGAKDPEADPEDDPEEDPETDPEEDPDDPKPAVKPDLCCPADKPKCACGSCVFDPDNQLACDPGPGWDGDCCRDLRPQPPVKPPAPIEVAECCTAEAPACCCGFCATQEFCSVVDCLPDAPAGCCGDEEAPAPEPPAPQPETCCKKGLQCCCGACQSPDTCAIIRCALDPEDDGTCCNPHEEAEEEEPEEPEDEPDEQEEERPVRGRQGRKD